MRAHTNTNIRRRRPTWRFLISLAVACGALALPAAAGARAIDSGPYVVPASQSAAVGVASQATIGRPNEGFVTPDHLRYTGPPFDTSQPVTSAGDGFNWGDAGLGAAAALALTALAGAAVVIRRRTHLTPSAS